MALTSFDSTFDFTFDRADVDEEVVFPPVGGDGGGGIPGAVLPFAENPNLLPSCLHPQGQGWERWQGVPLSLPGYLLPFIVAVPMPDDLSTSVYCEDGGKILQADSGEVIGEFKATFHRMTNGTTLYIIHSGSALVHIDQSAFILPDGNYRVQVGDSVSDVFQIRRGCGCLLRVRLLNDSPLGELLYGKHNFSQIFYVDGVLEGPSYDESETRSGDTKTAGVVTKRWVLSLDGASEPIADALALAGLHRLVEVAIVKADGTPSRIIQAMEYQAKAQIAESTTGGKDITLTLPVSKTSWNAAGSSVTDCLTDAGVGSLVDLDCEV